MRFVAIRDGSPDQYAMVQVSRAEIERIRKDIGNDITGVPAYYAVDAEGYAIFPPRVSEGWRVLHLGDCE